jgi:hypothetical protein
VEGLPQGLSVERHVLLQGRERHPWYRRVLFALICALPVLALSGLFGQHATTSAATGPGGTLKVQAPKRLRGGLMYQVRMDVTATQTIKEPQLVLSPGWWEQNSENSIAPDPVSQSSSNGRVTLSYGPVHAGEKLTVWAYFQVNPINVGHRDANVTLTDGPRLIATVHRTLTILP